MATTTQDPALFVIFGASGDLATRKLFPALAQSIVEGLLNERTRLVGVGRAAKTDEAFRADIREALAEAKFTPEQSQAMLERLHYQPIGESTIEDFRALAQRLQSLCEQHQIPADYAFYLSLPSEAMPATVAGFGEVGLHQREGGWTRIVLEKPFGRDLASSSELSHMVHRYFTEEQIYRIDHSPVERVSLTLRAINEARAVRFWVTGEDKASRVAAVFREIESGAPALPAAQVQPSSGELVWFLDHAAAGRL